MDEYSTGMDPEMKRYFQKIMKTFGVGLFWMLVMGTAGLFFRLGLTKDGVRWYNLLFYGVFVITLVSVVLFFYRVWTKNE